MAFCRLDFWLAVTAINFVDCMDGWPSGIIDGRSYHTFVAMTRETHPPLPVML